MSESTSYIASADPSANKKMGFPTMMAICVGLVIAQGVMISALQGIGIGGMAFIFAMIIALILAQFNAMSFAELSLMFPQEGTLATYTQKAIGHFPAIVAVFAGYVVVAVLALPVEMFLVDAILGELFPGLLPEKAAPLLILVLFTITNLIGTDVFSKVQNLLAFILVSALIITGATAITSGLQSPQELAGTPVDWSFGGVLNGSVIGLVGLALWTMVGVEFICPLINSVKDPAKNVPRAMHLSLFMIFTIFVAFAFGASLLLDVETIMASPLPFIDYAGAVFGKSGLIIAAVMAVTATCSTMNTVLAAVPRMLQGMAEQGQVFPQLKAKNKHDAPWVGILMISVLTTIPFFIFGIDSLIMLIIAATTSWLLAYCVAHINVIVLRKRLPNHDRPYRTPFFPIPQVLGIAAMLYVAANNSPAPEMTQMVYTIAGGILLLVSITAALWVKFYMKRGLFEPDMS
ncbi:APC family permease [Marinomonas sp. C2222]|uniref:APC family permease n=1 Tax=Marinomonas sargassi TaxID=2984494 RepID=A0ABT2YPW0_9GAMM|nr:APC family permease [Marinomonas sargassi]MCV2401914.1 APC family permease [Marinomonas sargassi]